MKIYFEYETGRYCGESNWEVLEVPDDTTPDELDALAWAGALETCMMYGVEDEEDQEQAYGTWEVYKED